jgi:hypothetical protein
MNFLTNSEQIALCRRILGMHTGEKKKGRCALVRWHMEFDPNIVPCQAMSGQEDIL